jgi:RimJ/RimL family protein N-acetyltransferase
MTYVSDKITLRPLTKEDLKGNYLNWFENPLVTKYNSHGLFPKTKEELDKFILSIENKERLVWVILIKIFDNDYTHIGNISLQTIDWINRTCEIAIIIGEMNYHEKGIATEVFKMIIGHGFNKLGINKIWGGTAESNIAMQRVFEKCNFKLEGVLRNEILIEGKLEHIYRYGILKSDWRK